MFYPAKKNACKLLIYRRFYLFSAVRTGLEPATPCVTGMYSNQAELPDQEMYELR